MHNLNALIFDLDGTLTLTQHLHQQSFAEVFKQQGLDFTKEDDMRYAGKGSHCIFPEFFKEHGIEISDDQTEQYAEEKKKIYDELLKKSKVKEVPGALEFVRRMKERGLKTAVASGNKIEAIEYILDQVGITPFIDVMMVNKYVKHSKPAPDVFLTSAHRLEVVPEECIVFEDALNGIEAARAGGMKCVALTTGFSREVLQKAGADEVFSDFTEITDEVLEKLFE